MKILLVNKFHYLKGGSEKYYFELGELLKEHGHEVAWFSMEDDKNITTGDKEYFVEKFDLNNGSKLKALDVIYSKENKKLMEKALDEFKPDIVHLNNFQRQLSASIVNPIKERNIPIVFTAHDVQAICPAITMLDSEGNICEKCMKGKYSNCIKKKCNKGSILKSVIGAMEGRYYRKHRIYTQQIDKIITPTIFYKQKLIEDGIDESKIIAIHNSINVDEYNLETSNEGYALYIGRLSKEKGILNLIKSFKNIKNGKLFIAGDGPEKENIENYIKDNKLDKRIKLLGFLNKDDVNSYISKCSFVVIPSIWYENCPYSVLETQAIGKPIISAKIGGLCELIKNNETGLLYRYDDIDDLTAKMKKMLKNIELSEFLGNNSKLFAKMEYDREKYYNEIVKIYNSLINKNSDKIR